MVTIILFSIQTQTILEVKRSIENIKKGVERVIPE